MRLIIADDHAMFRESLRSLLEARDHVVVGEARDGREAISQCETVAPDVALLDLSMPNLGGLEALSVIAKKAPGVKVIVLTASEDEEDRMAAIQQGAWGFLSKNLEADRLFGLLDAIERDEAPPPTPLRRKSGTTTPEVRALFGSEALTQRELEVLRVLVDGVTSNRRLAEVLGVSENTVRFHVRNILEKLGLHSRAQAISYAVRKGVVEVSD
ncbi:MAG: response regulator transcription factor [Thermoanaerobaculia bacterium]|nr:response regulator transcription factor [Thermoanaerobaculia bacterium]